MREKKSLDGLVDIRDVKTDRSQPKMKRIIDYDRQLNGHTHYKYKDVEIIAIFPKNAPPIEDRLMGIMV